MNNTNFQNQLNALRRQIFRTRVGGVVGLLGLGLGMGVGVHHLGTKHHETFKEFYDKHKKPRKAPVFTPTSVPPPPLLLTERNDPKPMNISQSKVPQAEIEKRTQSVLREAASYNVPPSGIVFGEDGSVKYLKHPHWMPGKPIKAAWKFNADSGDMEIVDPDTHKD
jgi:hypothetical protein